MRDRSAAAVAGLAPAARLEPDAISAAQDTVIGMANAAPAVSVGLTLAALAAATAYAGGPVIVVTALPMLVIANAYRRLNMWNANCGASFEWVGRAINPYRRRAGAAARRPVRVALAVLRHATGKRRRPPLGLPRGQPLGVLAARAILPLDPAGKKFPMQGKDGHFMTYLASWLIQSGRGPRGRAVSRFVTTGCDAARLLRVWTM